MLLFRVFRALTALTTLAGLVGLSVACSTDTSDSSSAAAAATPATKPAADGTLWKGTCARMTQTALNVPHLPHRMLAQNVTLAVGQDSARITADGRVYRGERDGAFGASEGKYKYDFDTVNGCKLNALVDATFVETGTQAVTLRVRCDLATDSLYGCDVDVALCANVA